jgi:hypothetical protein
MAAFIGLLISVAGRLTLPAFSFGELSLLSVGTPLMYVLAAASFCLLVAPLAVYFALARD